MQKSGAQQTLRNYFTVEGVGMHSGVPVRMTLRPAFADTGIVFVRTDITDRDNVVPARWDTVTNTRLCTVVSNAAGASVSTVEHILSALSAMGVDNAIVEVDGAETPIMDSSARAFVDAIGDAGLKKQAAPRRVLRIRKPVVFTDGDKSASFTPADGRFFDFEIVFASALIGRQTFSHALTPAAYRRDIASARNFGFLQEAEALQKMGLARGASLENTIIIDGDKVLNPGGLRFADEFVRHKILDAVGDLSLAGMQFIGRYQGVKSGHALNNQLLRALFARPDAYEIVTLKAEETPYASPARARYAEAALPAAVTA